MDELAGTLQRLIRQGRDEMDELAERRAFADRERGRRPRYFIWRPPSTAGDMSIEYHFRLVSGEDLELVDTRVVWGGPKTYDLQVQTDEFQQALQWLSPVAFAAPEAASPWLRLVEIHHTIATLQEQADELVRAGEFPDEAAVHARIEDLRGQFELLWEDRPKLTG